MFVGAAALLLLLTSCRELVVPAGGPTPVISLVLVSSESLQVASITFSTRPDSAIPDSALPVPAAAVDLAIVDAAGVAVPMAPGSEPGAFVAQLSPAPGARYRLAGTVAGVEIAALTVVPAAFTILEPAGDTIGLADGTANNVLLYVPYAFAASGVAGFGYRAVSADGVVQIAGETALDSGELALPRHAGTQTVYLFGYDAAAAAWLVGHHPRGNVTGALGCFGSALVVRRFLDAPP